MATPQQPERIPTRVEEHAKALSLAIECVETAKQIFATDVAEMILAGHTDSEIAEKWGCALVRVERVHTDIDAQIDG